MSKLFLYPLPFLTFIVVIGAYSAAADHHHAAATASTLPAGRLAEMHSCELYTGGCTASSEFTQEGRYRFRVWQFDRGDFQGQDLTGQAAALLETSASANLATPNAVPDHAALYLPESATAAQRLALTAWVQKNTQVNLASAPQKVVPLSARINWEQTDIYGGPSLAVSATAPLACDSGTSCGESLWYSPSSETTGFIVDVVTGSTISEPALQTNWQEHSRANLFVGYFGQPAPKGLLLCGAPSVVVNTP